MKLLYRAKALFMVTFFPRRDAAGVPTETTERAGNEDPRGPRAASKEEKPAALPEERQRLPSCLGDGIHQLW